MKSKEIDGKIHWFNDNNKKILSFSHIMTVFNHKYLFCPKKILQKATTFGVQLSEEIQDYFIEGKKGHLWQAIKNILAIINEQKACPKCAEKHVGNDIWHGYLDIDCDNCFVEIKTRSKFKLDWLTIAQCEFYKEITNKPYIIIYLNKNTFEAKLMKPDIDLQLKAKLFVKTLKTATLLANENIK